MDVECLQVMCLRRAVGQCEVQHKILRSVSMSGFPRWVIYFSHMSFFTCLCLCVCVFLCAFNRTLSNALLLSSGNWMSPKSCHIVRKGGRVFRPMTRRSDVSGFKSPPEFEEELDLSIRVKAV